MNAEALLAHYERIAEAPDAIARLRRFVLDLAVRGKLVLQDPRDESASELLKRIQRKRALVERTGRRARTAGAPATFEYTDEAPGGWKVVTLAELATVLNGRAYKQHELLVMGTPVLRVGNLFTSDKWYYSDLKLDADKYIEHGDLIYAWSASFGPFIWNGDRVIYHYHIWKLALHSQEDLDKSYFYNVLLQKTREIKAAGHGVSMIHMTKEKMERLEIPVPPLAEQRRIVAKVDELMALCDRLAAARTTREVTRDRLTAASLARLNTPDPETFTPDVRFTLDALPALTTRPDQIKQLRQTILNLAMSGRFSSKGVWPAHPQPLSTVAQLQNGHAFKSEWFSTSGIRLARNANVGHGQLDWVQEVRLPEAQAAEFERFLLNEGDVLLSLDRPFIVTGTKVARVCAADLPALLLQRVGRFIVSSSLDPDYLYLWVTSPHFTAQIDPGRSNGVPHISSKQVEAAKLFVPPLAEQHHTVAKVNALMALCDQLEANLITASTTRVRLLEATLCGALMPAEETLLEAAQ